MRSRGNRSDCFPRSHKCLFIRHNSKIENKTAKNRSLDASWHTDLSQFQGARPDHVRVESCCFLGELLSFVRSRELLSFANGI